MDCIDTDGSDMKNWAKFNNSKPVKLIESARLVDDGDHISGYNRHQDRKMVQKTNIFRHRWQQSHIAAKLGIVCGRNATIGWINNPNNNRNFSAFVIRWTMNYRHHRLRVCQQNLLIRYYSHKTWFHFSMMLRGWLSPRYQIHSWIKVETLITLIPISGNIWTNRIRMFDKGKSAKKNVWHYHTVTLVKFLAFFRRSDVNLGS